MSTNQSGEWSGDKPLPEAFLDLPRNVYADYPQWIPESAPVVSHLFSSKNQYFKAGKVWLGVNDDSRLAGFIAPHQVIEDKKAAYFGFWETKDAPESNESLFAEFEAWAKGQGAEIIYGPINFSTYGMYRIRIDGFSESQFVGEPFNPPYYPEMLASLGYSIVHKYASSGSDDLQESVDKNREFVASLEEKLFQEYNIKNLTVDYWMDNIDRLFLIADEIFKANFAYTPISQSDFEAVCGKSFAKKICKHSSLVAETKDGEIAGMMLCFPDYGPLVCQGSQVGINPELLDFEEHFQKIPSPVTLLMKTAGITADHRGKHLYTYLFLKSAELALPYYDASLACLFSLGNPSKKAVDRMSEGLRHYGLYAKEL